MGKGWERIEQIDAERIACTLSTGHIWASARGGYCVMCGLIVGRHKFGPTAAPNMGGKKVNRPSWNNRAELISRLAERDGGMWCWYCTIPLDVREVTIDHAVPLSSGRQWHNEENFRLCCATCNHWKGNLTEPQFRRSSPLEERQRWVAKMRARELHPFETSWNEMDAADHA